MSDDGDKKIENDPLDHGKTFRDVAVGDDEEAVVLSPGPQNDDELDRNERAALENGEPLSDDELNRREHMALDDDEEPAGLEAQSSRPGLEVDWYHAQDEERAGLEAGDGESAGLEAGDQSDSSLSYSRPLAWIGKVRVYDMGGFYVVKYPKNLDKDPAGKKLLEKRLKQIMLDATINKGWDEFYAHEKAGLLKNGQFSSGLMSMMDSAKKAQLDTMGPTVKKMYTHNPETGKKDKLRDDLTPKQKRIYNAFLSLNGASFATDAARTVGSWAWYNPFAHVGQAFRNLTGDAKEKAVDNPKKGAKTEGLLGIGGLSSRLS